MNTKLTWDHRKRQINLLKHGLDFEHADELLSSRFCLHFPISKLDEPRVISFSYVLSHLCVLALVHNQRHDQIRLISFRKASREETIAYFRWLEHERIDSTWSARKNTSNQPRPFLCLEWSWSRRPTSDPRTISAIGVSIGVRSTLIWLDHHLAPLNGVAYGIVNASPKLKSEGSAGEFVVVQSGRGIAIEFDGHQRARRHNFHGVPLTTRFVNKGHRHLGVIHNGIVFCAPIGITLNVPIFQSFAAINQGDPTRPIWSCATSSKGQAWS